MDNLWILVGGFNPSEKYEFVNWDDDIPKSYGKIKVMFQSPPTSLACHKQCNLIWNRVPPSHHQRSSVVGCAKPSCWSLGKGLYSIPMLPTRKVSKSLTTSESVQFMFCMSHVAVLTTFHIICETFFLAPTGSTIYIYIWLYMYMYIYMCILYIYIYIYQVVFTGVYIYIYICTHVGLVLGFPAFAPRHWKNVRFSISHQEAQGIHGICEVVLIQHHLLWQVQRGQEVRGQMCSARSGLHREFGSCFFGDLHRI